VGGKKKETVHGSSDSFSLLAVSQQPGGGQVVTWGGVEGERPTGELGAVNKAAEGNSVRGYATQILVVTQFHRHYPEDQPRKNSGVGNQSRKNLELLAKKSCEKLGVRVNPATFDIPCTLLERNLGCPQKRGAWGHWSRGTPQ